MELKKKGRIKHISAGPNIVVWPDDNGGIVTRQEIELFLLPSEENVRRFIKRAPSMEGRCVSWPVGINMEVFSPIKPFRDRNFKKVLLYHKYESDQFCRNVEQTLRKRGYDTIILKYGSYVLPEYINLLRQSDFMVSISCAESQGIFMAEAWSMDVPTVCFDRLSYRYDVNGIATTCPYLAKENGVKFMELNELENILDNWDEIKKDLNPREWCKENMSDIVCARKFVEILNAKFGIK